jgi:hypothetical protein
VLITQLPNWTKSHHARLVLPWSRHRCIRTRHTGGCSRGESCSLQGLPDSVRPGPQLMIIKELIGREIVVRSVLPSFAAWCWEREKCAAKRTLLTRVTQDETDQYIDSHRCVLHLQLLGFLMFTSHRDTGPDRPVAITTNGGVQLCQERAKHAVLRWNQLGFANYS